MKNKDIENWSCEDLELDIELKEQAATIQNSFVCKKIEKTTELVLWGEGIQLLEVLVDDKKLKKSQYLLEKNRLTIQELTKISYKITIKTTIVFVSKKNTGLFLADKKIYTQTVKNNFNRITYFFSNPYLCLHHSCKITADKNKFPYLLADGQLVSQTNSKKNHTVLWRSIYAREIHQFSLVAGDFFVCKKKILLGKNPFEIVVYFPNQFKEYCQFSADCMQDILFYDKKVLGIPYASEQINIVALKNYKANIFQGKELNIFNFNDIAIYSNTAASITDYIQIDKLLAKSYFFMPKKKIATPQNWFHYAFYQAFALLRLRDYIASKYGNFYQDSLDLENYYNSDFIDKKQTLAPIDFFSSKENYFSDYYKVVRIMQMLIMEIGKESFFLILKNYFTECKKKETSLELFMEVLRASQKKKLKNLELWFTEQQVPELKVLEYYNKALKIYRLFFFQVDKSRVSPFHEQYWNHFLEEYDKKTRTKILQEKDYSKSKSEIIEKLPLTSKPFFFYLAVDKNVENNLYSSIEQNKRKKVVEIKSNFHKDFAVYETLKLTPFFNSNLVVPLKIGYTGEEQEQGFFRLDEREQHISWHTFLLSFFKIFNEQLERYLTDKVIYLDDNLVVYLQKIITKSSLFYNFVYKSICFPSEEKLFKYTSFKNTEAIHHIREYLQSNIGKKLSKNFLNLYHRCSATNSDLDEKNTLFKNTLKNICLVFIAYSGQKEPIFEQYKNSKSFEDTFAAMQAINNFDLPERKQMLKEKEKKWKNNFFLMRHWFYLLATAKHPKAIDEIEKITQHSLLNNKKLQQAIIFYKNFVENNFYCFHNVQGRGYELLKNFIIQLDRIDLEMSIYFVSFFKKLENFPAIKEQKKQESLRAILKAPISKKLSRATQKYLDNE